MSTVTVARGDLTTAEVATVLRDGLGAGYNVLPGMAIGQLDFMRVRQGRPNTIVVGTGDNRLIKAQVTITPQGGQTKLRIRPGGITLYRLLNTLGVAREVRRVLANSPGLSAR